MIRFEDDSIQKVRTGKNFLPAYSSYAYEKKKNILNSLSGISFFALLLSIFIEIGWIQNGLWWFGLLFTTAFGFVLAYSTVLYGVFDRKKWKRGYRLMPTEVQYLEADGQVRYAISNESLRSQILEGQVCYQTDALKLGKGRNSISFPYEIGRSNQHNRVAKFYEALEKNLGISLPTFDKKDIELLDRRFYYRKSQLTNSLSLAAAIFVCWVGTNIIETDIGMYVMCGIVGLWECAVLSAIHLAAVNSVKNQKKIQKAFQEIPHTSRLGFTYRGVVVFAAVAISTLFFNLKFAGII